MKNNKSLSFYVKLYKKLIIKFYEIKKEYKNIYNLENRIILSNCLNSKDYDNIFLNETEKYFIKDIIYLGKRFK